MNSDSLYKGLSYGLIGVLLFVFLILLLVSVALSNVAYAQMGAPFVPKDDHGHEDFWIDYGNYKSPTNGTHCCGEDDCILIPAEEMTGKSDGWHWLVGEEVIPYSETQTSEDGEFWRCKMHNGDRRCFFAPQPSS